MTKQLNADDAYDTLARLLRARDVQQQAIKEAMDLLWEAKGKRWDAPYKAAEYVYEDMMHQENFQTVIDAIEELAEVLEDD